MFPCCKRVNAHKASQEDEDKVPVNRMLSIGNVLLHDGSQLDRGIEKYTIPLSLSHMKRMSSPALNFVSNQEKL